MTRLRKDILNSIFIGNFFALLLFILLTIIVVLQEEKKREEYRSDLSDKVASIKNTIEVEFSQKIYLTTGIAAVVRAHPTITQSQFSSFAKQVLLNSGEPVRCIQLVKDSIISHIYPTNGNEEVLGVNIYKRLNNKSIFVESIENKKPNMSGPLKLIQGGLGYIYRIPIYVNDSTNNTGERFWGFSAIVVDVDSMLSNISFFKDTTDSYAIRTVKGFNSIPYFYGDSLIFEDNPVKKTINVSFNEWEIAARPKMGWKNVKSLETWSYVLGILICLLGGILIGFLSFIFFRLKQLNVDLTLKNETIQQQIEEKGLLIKEIHHRVKNHFQMVSSIARIQAYESKNPEIVSVLKEMEARIRSFSMAHEQLYKSEQETTNLKEYVEGLSHQLVAGKKDSVELTLEIKVEEIPFKVSIYLGIIINELITNSLKHAFKDSSKQSHIYLSITKNEDKYELKYVDNGIGIPKQIFEKNENSFGLELIRMMTEQLGGEIKQIDVHDFSGILLIWE